MSQILKAMMMMAVVVITGCTSVAPDPYDAPGAGPSPAELAVDACNIRGHLQCINLTAKETWEDGSQLKWTRHWWRMSYIGRACEKEHGKKTGVFLEGLFALPHYFAMGVANAVATFAYPFRVKNENEIRTETPTESAPPPNNANT